MEINNYVLAGAAAATTLIVGASVWIAVKAKRENLQVHTHHVDLTSFKRSMDERYKHLEAINIDDDVRKEIIKGVHFNIANDITHLFSGAHHAELNTYNEKLYSKYL